MTIYTWITIAAWAAFLLYWFVLSPRSKSTGAASPYIWARLLVAFAVAVLFYTGVVKYPAAYALTAPLHPFLSALGAAFAVIGISFAIWARYYLGTNWDMPRTERKEAELVTSGPYAYVRHPIYTGVILALLGSTLASGGWWILVFIGYATYFVYSAKKEETAMLKKFPNEYPSYIARTKMLVPFVF